jgi:hypothetical protein
MEPDPAQYQFFYPRPEPHKNTRQLLADRKKLLLSFKTM